MEASKFELLYNDLGRAIASFKSALSIELLPLNESIKDAVLNGQIQKFEYTIELTWKLVKAYFGEKRDKKINFPKENIKAIFEEEYINEENYTILIDAISCRNLLSHIYKEDYFIEIIPKLHSYAIAIEALYNAF